MIALTDLKMQIARRKSVNPIPATVSELLRLSEDPHASLKDFEAVIAKDPATAAEVLRHANSPLYAPRSEIKSLTHAVAYLGIETVKNVVLTSALKASYGETSFAPEVWKLLWNHALTTAVAGTVLARMLKTGSPDEWYTLGLLHDYGKAVLLRLYPDEYLTVFETANREKIPFVEAERSLSEVTHTEAGFVALGFWRLPPAVLKAVRTHHDPESRVWAPGTVVHYASAVLGYSMDPLESIPVDDALKKLGVPKEELDEFKKRLIDETKKALPGLF